MGGKPRIIPDRTYVLEDKDLEEFEELTIATVMQETLDTDEEHRETPDDGAAESDDERQPGG